MPDAEIPEHNFMVDCRETHAELLDLETGTVWQSQRPISREAYDALVLPASLIRVGIGTGVMDAHYFRRSPGADADGPVAERDVEGRLFIHCANPPRGGPEFPVGDDPRLLRVDKHHSLIFDAGREVEVIRLADGRDFVQVIAAARPDGDPFLTNSAPTGAAGFHLPEGWQLRSEKLAVQTTIHLPSPTHAWFFENGASFQGPIDTFAA